MKSSALGCFASWKGALTTELIPVPPRADQGIHSALWTPEPVLAGCRKAGSTLHPEALVGLLYLASRSRVMLDFLCPPSLRSTAGGLGGSARPAHPGNSPYACTKCFSSQGSNEEDARSLQPSFVRIGHQADKTKNKQTKNKAFSNK